MHSVNLTTREIDLIREALSTFVENVEHNSGASDKDLEEAETLFARFALIAGFLPKGYGFCDCCGNGPRRVSFSVSCGIDTYSCEECRNV